MRLQKSTRLALCSVVELASQPGQRVSAGEIASKYGESPHHLAKVLASLARAGVVESVRGVGGGYRFIGNARRLTLLELIRLFEEPGAAGEASPDADTQTDRAITSVLAEIDQYARATFGSISITTLLGMVGRSAGSGE